MEELKLNLSRNEFSTGRKILLWVVATMFLLGGLWDIYMRLVKDDTSVSPGLTVTLFTISAFVFFLAMLASFQKKQHYFNVNNEEISYRYGLIFPSLQNHKWSEIKEIIIKYTQRKVILVMKNKKHVTINLNWIQRTNSKIILKHIYYSSRSIGLPVIRRK